MEASASNDSWEDEANSDRAASSDESEQVSNNSNNNSECEEEEEDEDEEEVGKKTCEDIPTHEPDEENEEILAQDTLEDKFIAEEEEEEADDGEQNDNDKNEFHEDDNVEDGTIEKENEQGVIDEDDDEDDDDNENDLLDRSDEMKDESKGLSSEEMASSPPAATSSVLEEEQADSEHENDFNAEKEAIDVPVEEHAGSMSEKTAEEESKHLSPQVTMECKSPIREVIDCHRNSSPEFGVECERTVIEDKVKISPIEHRLTEKRVVKIRDSGSLPQASLSEEHVELDYDEEDMEEPSTRTVSLEAKTDKDEKDDGEWDEERKVRSFICAFHNKI